MEVISPFNIAKDITNEILNVCSIDWKRNIVPKSPIEQPSRHHKVLLIACFQVCLQFQFIIKDYYI